MSISSANCYRGALSNQYDKIFKLKQIVTGKLNGKLIEMTVLPKLYFI